MTARDTLEDVQSRLTGKVRDGVIVVDDVELQEGATVTVIADTRTLIPPIRHAELEAHGDLIMTPELEAELEAAEAEADRGEGVPWSEVRERLRRL